MPDFRGTVGENQEKLVICGGGHVAQQAVILAKHTGFHVTVLEDRPFFADQARWQGRSGDL